MILYSLYRLGRFLSLRLPLGLSYRLACLMADACSLILAKDKRSVKDNLRLIMGNTVSEREIDKKARNVFRNFAKYLVDFFRASLVNDEYIKKNIRIEGLENINIAKKGGKGVILLSAHLGNWELGALVLSRVGYPISAVVLTHQNKKINDFFTGQRHLGNFTIIEIGASLRNCYKVLRSNGQLALLGDRDFSKNGLWIEFFGRGTLIPKGPAVLSYRLGAAMVPTFVVREEDDSFRIVLEPPIFPDTDKDESEAIMELAKRYSFVIESYVRRYPDQWYMFREVWNGAAKDLRPDTII